MEMSIITKYNFKISFFMTYHHLSSSDFYTSLCLGLFKGFLCEKDPWVELQKSCSNPRV